MLVCIKERLVTVSSRITAFHALHRPVVPSRDRIAIGLEVLWRLHESNSVQRLRLLEPVPIVHLPVGVRLGVLGDGRREEVRHARLQKQRMGLHIVIECGDVVPLQALVVQRVVDVARFRVVFVGLQTAQERDLAPATREFRHKLAHSVRQRGRTHNTSCDGRTGSARFPLVG
jgi:hypothetical protein